MACPSCREHGQRQCREQQHPGVPDQGFDERRCPSKLHGFAKPEPGIGRRIDRDNAERSLGAWDRRLRPALFRNSRGTDGAFMAGPQVLDGEVLSFPSEITGHLEREMTTGTTWAGRRTLEAPLRSPA